MSKFIVVWYIIFSSIFVFYKMERVCGMTCGGWSREFYLWSSGGWSSSIYGVSSGVIQNDTIFNHTIFLKVVKKYLRLACCQI